MNFGVNVYNWLASNIQSLGLAALLIVGIYLVIERKLSKVVGLVLVSIVAIGFIYNTTGVKDLFLQLFNSFFN